MMFLERQCKEHALGDHITTCRVIHMVRRKAYVFTCLLIARFSISLFTATQGKNKKDLSLAFFFLFKFKDPSLPFKIVVCIA